MGSDYKKAEDYATLSLILAIVVFSTSLSIYGGILAFFITCDKTAHGLFIFFGLCEVALLIAQTVFIS